VNRHMRFASDTLARAGFAVISPALFDRAEKGVELGYTSEDVQTGLALRAKINEEQVMMDIEAAAAALGVASVGIIGYCWGGTIAWWVWRRHLRDPHRDPQLPGSAAFRRRGSRHSADRR
jgi:carboxymethylenebutenolidase